MKTLTVTEAMKVAENSWHITSSFSHSKRASDHFIGLTLWYVTHGLQSDIPLRAAQHKLTELLGCGPLYDETVNGEEFQLVWGMSTVDSDVPFLIELSERGLSVRLVYGAPTEHANIVIAELRKILIGPISVPGLEKHFRD